MGVLQCRRAAETLEWINLGSLDAQTLERNDVGSGNTETMEWEFMGMTEELQRYYEDRFSMMAMPGWRDLIEDAKAIRAALDTLAGATQDNLLSRQGELKNLDWLLSLQDASEKAYEDLSNEDHA